MKDFLAAAWSGFREGFAQGWHDACNHWFYRHFWWFALACFIVSLILALCGVRS